MGPKLKKSQGLTHKITLIKLDVKCSISSRLKRYLCDEYQIKTIHGILKIYIL